MIDQQSPLVSARSGPLSSKSGQCSDRISESGIDARLLGIEWMRSAIRERGIPENVLDCGAELLVRDRERNANASLGTVLCRLGLMSWGLWSSVLAERLGWKVASESEVQEAAHESTTRLSISWCRSAGALVAFMNGSAPVVILASPTDTLLREVCRRAGINSMADLQLRIASQVEIEAGLREAGRATVSVQDLAGRRAIDAILECAAAEGASDVHFEPREKALEVKVRVDGKMWTRHVFEGSRKDELLANVKIAGGLDIGRRTEPLDGAGQSVVAGRTFKLRFSSMPSHFGEKVVVRLLDQEAAVLPLADLGLGPRDAAQVQEALALPQGLIFLVGPTGCGKSTTLAAMISQLDGHAHSIRTLENPIEYRLQNAIQSEIGDGMSFATGLRALLRQDPDYLLIGETRDLETAEISVEAGLTGHTCFSTLHASDALGGITRLLDLGITPGPLVASSHVFIAQRLVRRLCTKCSRPSEAGDLGIRKYRPDFDGAASVREPVGCPHCREGYRGRLGVYEVRWMRDFDDLVQAHGVSAARECRRRAQDMNLPTLFDDGLQKVAAGLTSLDELCAQVAPHSKSRSRISP